MIRHQRLIVKPEPMIAPQNYNANPVARIADARAKHWKCSKCQETFANYRGEITRIILMAISHVI